MTHASLNEEAVEAAAGPVERQPDHLFRGATIQGAKAPRGFGVRVTAAGARAFVLNYRLRGREYRFTIGAWPDWSALKAVREARKSTPTHRSRRESDLMIVRAIPPRQPSPHILDDFITRHVRNSKQPLRRRR